MIGWAAARPQVVLASAIALVCAGAVALTRLPFALRPVVEFPQLEIVVAWPGAAPEVVEAYVTAPIEAAVQPLRGVHRIRSESSDGLARLTVELDARTNPQLGRLAILERLQLLRTELPANAGTPLVGQYIPGEFAERPLMQLVLSGPYTPGTLAREVREVLLPRLAGVAGVSGVRVVGGADVGVVVAYDVARLRELGLGPDVVRRALEGASVHTPLAAIRTGAVERPAVLRDRPASLSQLSMLPLSGVGGRVVRLGEVAAVREEEDARDRFYRRDGLPAVSLEVLRLAGADALAVAAAVRGEAEALRVLLPPGMRLRVGTDESDDIARELHSVLWRSAAALVLIVCVLGVALRDVQAIGTVLFVATVGLAGTALGLFLLRIPGNLLTLAGLAMGLGLMAQNGVVVVSRLQQVAAGAAERRMVIRGIAPAVLGPSLATAVVLAPFLYLQGDSRAAFMPFAAAFVLALATSAAGALLLGVALPPPQVQRWPRGGRGPGLMARVLVHAFRWRIAWLLTVAAVLGIVSWGFVVKVPHRNLGDWLNERSRVGVTLHFPRGSDPASLDRAMKEFEQIATAAAGVEQVEALGGPAGASLRVTFAPEASFGAKPLLLQEALTAHAVGVGGASSSVYGEGPAFSNGGAGGWVAYRLTLSGYSWSALGALSADIGKRLRRLPRVRDVDEDAGASMFADRGALVTVAPDRPALASRGVSVAEFAAALGREIQGRITVQRVPIGGEERSVSLRAAGAEGRTLDALAASGLSTRATGMARLSTVATFGERADGGTIVREDQQYVRSIAFDFRGPENLGERVVSAFVSSLAVPPGYRIERALGFGQRPDDDSAQGLWLVFGAGVALVLLSVAFAYDSWWAAGVALLGLPPSLAAVGAAYWATGTGFGREGAVSVILVVGLSVSHTILLVDALLRARRRSGRLTVQAAIQAVNERAGLILTVTGITLASVAPFAVHESWSSLFGAIALGTLAGTVGSTGAALMVIPVLVTGRGRMRGPSSGIRDASGPRRCE